MSEIKVNKISPTSGGGTVTLATSGDTIQVPSGVTIANSGTATGFGGGTTKKRHHFTNSTRITPTAATDTDIFTWTAAFTPDDPVNNDMIIDWIVPMDTSGHYWGEYGISFVNNSTTTRYTYFYRGYTGSYDGSTLQASHGQRFNLAANTLPAGTYTVYYRNGGPASGISDQFMINTTDNADVGGQTVAELLITEWKNS